MDDLTGLVEIPAPKDVALGRALAIVGKDDAGNLPECRGVPEPAARRSRNSRRRNDVEVLRRCGDPIEERTPSGLRLIPAEALKDHLDPQTPASLQAELLAPLRVEDRLCVEVERLRHKPAISLVGRRVDRRNHRADDLGKLVRPERHARHDAEAAAAALDRPEEVRVQAGVGELDVAVGGHHLGLDEIGGGRAEGLGQAAKAAAVDEAADPDGQAASTLHVAPGLAHHLLIDASPDRARFD